MAKAKAASPGQNKSKVSKDDNSNKGISVASIVSYTFMFLIMILYSIYLHDAPKFKLYAQDYPVLQPLAFFFDKVEEVSPFHEFLKDQGEDEEMVRKHNQQQEQSGERILTKEELSRYDGSEGSPGLYLALLGQVFDVSKSPKFYGPGGGYGFFAGKDGSRAFVSGQFDNDGLTDDVEGLSSTDYIGLDDWVQFYHKDYKYVGKLVGRYFNKDGSATEYSKKYEKWLMEAKAESAANDAEKQIFPPCNSEWSQEKGQRVWCTAKSGGITRKWTGVPRRLKLPGKKERCACIKNTGPSLYDPAAAGNVGDLNNPHLKTYELCTDPKSTSCQVKNAEDK